MSYQVLARKYRPRDFESLVGQGHVVKALTHALEQKRLHHAWLFTGTRGVGKTTLSRILAKALNCTGPDGSGDITGHPCGQCEACAAIDAGRFVDYMEMDAASNRGVDEMAQLLEQAIYAPTNARYKVYMIDEVHMLTNHAFNAMLKTLEEPPEHVKFILATTDPQKIPVTVLSRCLQFNLKQMPPGHIVDHLDHILKMEGIAHDPAALRLLAKGAGGSMRDALSLTDQAIAYAAGPVTLEAVSDILGALDQTCLIRILDALAEKSGATLLDIADEMQARSLSFRTALEDLASLIYQIALAQSVPDALSADLPEREAVLRLASIFSAEEIQLLYQIAIHGRSELGLAPDEYTGFTMSLLRMLAFFPAAAQIPLPVVPPPAAERVSTPARRPGGATPAAPPSPASAAPAPRNRAGSPAQAALAALCSARGKPRGGARTPSAPTSTTADQPAPPPEPPEPALPATAVQTTPNAPLPTELGFNGDWPDLAAQLHVRGVAREMALQSALGHYTPQGKGYEFELIVPAETLCSAANANRLAEALGQHFGREFRIHCKPGRVADSASLRTQAHQHERQQNAERSIREDPFVIGMIEQFDAVIVPDSIRPRDKTTS